MTARWLLELSCSIRLCHRLLSAFNKLAAKTATEWRRSVVFPWNYAGQLSQHATETIVHLGTEAGAARFWSEPGKQPNGIKSNPTGSRQRQLKAPRKFPEKSELTSHVQR